MKRVSKLLPVLTASVLAAGFLTSAAHAAASSPFPAFKLGPRASLAGVTGPAADLFGCQTGQASWVCYDPYQIRHAYTVDSLLDAGWTGAGRTIVIVDAFQSPNIVQELNEWDGYYGLPGLNGLGQPHDASLGTFTQIAPDGLVPFDPADPVMIGWAGEITMDVEWAHAMAPGASIVLALAGPSQDTTSVTKYAVDHRLGDVISQSFGEAESCVSAPGADSEHQVFAEATLKGMTLFASSGDWGAAMPSCDGSALIPDVSLPASDPLVTAVGGTELHAAGYCLSSLGCDPATSPAPGTYQGESVWNEPLYGLASGGGFSAAFDRPSYQAGTVHGENGRAVPDVAFSAALDHGLVAYVDIPGIPAGFYGVGGTSAGAPQWAAIVAIADQKARHDLGFINAGLYRIAQARPGYASSFFDVTRGDNSVDGIVGFSAKPGWDAATGLGSPKSAQLVDALIEAVSPGDGRAAVAGSTPHWNGKPTAPGHVAPD